MSLKEILYFNKKKIILIILFITILILVLFYYLKINYKDEVIVDEEFFIKEEKEEVINNEMCFVDLKGEVKNPGVYEISCLNRVNDLINISGGLTKNSDTSVINLSKKIEDGMVVIVYSKKEVSNYLETLKKEEQKQTLCNSSNIKNDGCISNSSSNSSSSSNTSSLININTASLEELMTLTGIGESKAKNIISYRNEKKFSKVEDLLEVEGIGESIYSKIKKNITV